MKKVLGLIILILFHCDIPAQQNSFSRLVVPFAVPALYNTTTPTDILEDHLGYIWIGTQNGLYKFDGYSTTRYQYDPNTPDHLAGAWISSLAEDDSGNIWIGVFGIGLQKLDPLTDQFTLYKPGTTPAPTLINNKITALHFFGKRLWIDTQAGICSFTPSTGKFKVYSGNLYDQTVIHDGREIWQLSWNPDFLVLLRYDAGQDQFVATDTIRIRSVLPVVADFTGNRLFLNVDGTLYSYRTDSRVLTPLNTGANDPVTAVSRFGNSLAIYCTSGRFENYDIPRDNLEISQGYSMACIKIIRLRNGDLWGIGYYVFRIRPDKAGISNYTFSADGNFVHFEYQSLLSEWRRGLLGIGAGATIDLDSIKAFNSGALDPSLAIFDSSYTADKDANIYVDDNGDTWIALFSKPREKLMLFKYTGEGKRLVSLGSLPMSKSHMLFGITRIGDDVWIATWEGMIKWSISRCRAVRVGKDGDATRSSPSSVRYCFRDRDNDLWVATQNGLYLKKAGSNDFTVFTARPGDTTALSFNGISTIAQDATGIVWIGTQGGGVDLFNKKTGKFSWLTTRQGLADNNINNLIIDKKNKIWVSYPTGIARIDPATKKILSFSASDALFSYGENNAICLSDGSLIFASSYALTRIFPDKIADSQFIPALFITGLELFHHAVVINGPDSLLHLNISVTHSLTLHYDQNVITLQYAALDMLTPDQRTYAYQLEGFDTGWQYVDHKRDVTYTNLAPGHYTFRVKSADRYGHWTEMKIPLRINILPPWWRTWWAYTLYVLLFLAATGAFISYRSAALRKQNRVLEERVINRTDALKKSLEDLRSTQAQLVQSEKMASLGELTAGIAHEIQNPLNFVNNFSEINRELLTDLKEELAKGNLADVGVLANDVMDNEEKINHHGKRADAIVKNMLQHSRQTTGGKEPTNINALCEEYLRLSFHGMRAKDKSFQAAYTTRFSENVGNINIVPQDIGRVLLNLYNNAFYAVTEQQKAKALKQEAYHPLVTVTTRLSGPGNAWIEIVVGDNGGGIPENVADKIFQPFFTTKPTGQGTGLGLSLSYDIVKAHGGILSLTPAGKRVDREGSEFMIRLPA